jgi:imidazolonepropionase-like amidohydrolase
MFRAISRNGTTTVLLLLVNLCACRPPQVGKTSVIVGAILLDGQGGPPMSDSVVVVTDGQIVAAGPRSTIPIPQEADKVDGASRYLMPGIIDICDRADPPGMVRAATPEDARAQVEKLAAAHVSPIHMAALPQPVAQAGMEAARAAHTPVIVHISTYAEAETMLAAGASGFVGMIRDREVDPAFAAHARDLRIFFAPALASTPLQWQEMAQKNTLLLFKAGAPIAVASAGAVLQRELEMLAEAGIPPLDIVVAATRNGAAALGKLGEEGIVQRGKLANLLLLSANPGEDIHNLRKVAMRMNSTVFKR